MQLFFFSNLVLHSGGHSDSLLPLGAYMVLQKGHVTTDGWIYLLHWLSLHYIDILATV